MNPAMLATLGTVLFFGIILGALTSETFAAILCAVIGLGALGTFVWAVWTLIFYFASGRL